MSIVTYQNDDVWGLCPCEDQPPLELTSPEPESIFRDRHLNELPVGEITAVKALVDATPISGPACV